MSGVPGRLRVVAGKARERRGTHKRSVQLVFEEEGEGSSLFLLAV
jgi:hypothetical protein